MTTAYDLVVGANGAQPDGDAKVRETLRYTGDVAARNLKIGLPRFVQDVFHLPDRLLDLLEIAAFVYASDRLAHRGRRDLVEYHAWSRRFLFNIRVRDEEFWSREDVRALLNDALTWMSGDAEYTFNFSPGHSTPPTGLFDVEGFSLESDETPVTVSLFSGGLDSLSGAVETLEDTDTQLILVSHQSQPSTMRTQRALVQALKERYPGRLSHYEFVCHLKGIRGREETQRTRSFLYCSIGFAIAQAYATGTLQVHENGVTSLNFARREDLKLARASRTTHPRSLGLLSRLFSLIADVEFTVALPYLWRTKRDVIEALDQRGGRELIASSVSCSRTYQNVPNATHCGVCFQCIDRRLAVHAAGLEAWDDPGLYSVNAPIERIEAPEARTTIIDYIRQAKRFRNASLGAFELAYVSEMADAIDYVSGGTEAEIVERMFELMRRHGGNVHQGIAAMRERYDDPFEAIPDQSLLSLVARREYLKRDVERLVASLAEILRSAVGEMFREQKPENERDLNAKVGALLRTHEPELRSEHPTASFACAKVVPDHELEDKAVVLEGKYVRDGTSPSKASEGIAADLTKYPDDSHVLFYVYDPNRAIHNDEQFRKDFESKGGCSVLILR